MRKIFNNAGLAFGTSNIGTFAAVILSLFTLSQTWAQEVIKANGPGNTYDELTAFLAPGYNPIEVPDCNHTSFGNHIDEVYDSSLGDYAYSFFIHVTPDNDRCIATINDRQRNEIKTYDKSPANLKGVQGEKVIYKWGFKLADGFQSSPKFTHFHQLKSVGGSYSSMPMYTLTTRKGTPDKLQLRYAEIDAQITLKETPLSPFIGDWVEVTEKIEYTAAGFYSIEIVNKFTGQQLFYYDNTDFEEPKINWRPGASFVRPKWGIYRSLVYEEDLRDEQVLFSYFSIEEVSSLNTSEVDQRIINVFPNPTSGVLHISSIDAAQTQIFAISGQMLLQSNSAQIDISDLAPSLYFLKVFDKNNNLLLTHKVLKFK
jgi:hypothetical protein